MGELKPGWTRVKFGEVVRQVKDRVDPTTAGLERYVAGEHMDTDDLRIRRWGDVGDGYLGPAFHMRFKPGHVLYGSRRTYLRKVAIADFEGVCANTTFVLESVDSSRLLSEFLPFVMQAESFHEHSRRESRGSVNPYVNFSDLVWYEFTLPPIDEQWRLVSTFRAASLLLESLHTAVVASTVTIDAFARSTYRNALKHGKLRRVDDFAEVRMGRQKAPKYSRGVAPTPFLRVVNVGHLELDLSSIEMMDFEGRDRNIYRLEAGDVLVTEGDLISVHNVGRPAVFSGEIVDCCYQNTLIRLRCQPDVDPWFVALLLEGARLEGLFARVAKSTTVAHLGLRRFCDVTLPIIAAECQRGVRITLSCLLGARTALRERLAEAQHMYKDLLRGLHI